MPPPAAPHVKMETLTRFLFTAPPWHRSLLVILLLGPAIDGVSYLLRSSLDLTATLLFTIPALFAFLATKPLVDLLGGTITWNRSALLALVCQILGLAGTLGTFFLPGIDVFPFLYAYSLGFLFALRLLVITAVADYRTRRSLLPSSLQSIAGIGIGAFLFPSPFLAVAIIANLALAAGCALLLWFIELPFYRAFHIHGLRFISLFLDHLTTGSRDLEDFFRKIGEEATVPQVSLSFSRPEREPILLTVPNLHPGPMGDIGGTNLPSILYAAFPGEVLVAHGCATHDFNLVAASEMEKVIAAVRQSLAVPRAVPFASRSFRYRQESVEILCQVLGESVLLIATRSPKKTEDIDPAIGQIIMTEGKGIFSHIAFVDAHNCMTEVTTPVHPSTPLGEEYIRAAREAMEIAATGERVPFRAGVAHLSVPFGRKEGFGPLGILCLVIEAGGQRTAYILLDGNNILEGGRETLLSAIREDVEEAEVMTTDSHVVNTITGKNPIGYSIPATTIAPYVKEALQQALQDLAPAEVAGATATCERVVIFGKERISQLASTVNTIVLFLIPLSLTILILAFFLSIIVYMVML
jgi:putative membrane protein